MVRGVGSDMAPMLVKVKRERNKEGKLLKYAKRFFNIGVSPMKSALYKNLPKSDPQARGYRGFPRGMGDDFFQQLCSERRVPVKRSNGATEYQWHRTPNVRNEALDTELYADAGAIRQGWRQLTEGQWDRLAAEIEKPIHHGQMDLEDVAAQLAPVASPPPVASDPARPPQRFRQTRFRQ
jgi:phage terminase large subunit GpA-like protein